MIAHYMMTKNIFIIIKLISLFLSLSLSLSLLFPYPLTLVSSLRLPRPHILLINLSSALSIINHDPETHASIRSTYLSLSARSP